LIVTLTIPADLEQDINSLVERGEYPNAEAVLVHAVRALLRDQQRLHMESLLDANGIDEQRLDQLLKEALKSGDYSALTTEDWHDIELEGMAILNARKSA
jgi:Arc/MetJ-type ribon-helix-helix transcriptional regulator